MKNRLLAFIFALPLYVAAQSAGQKEVSDSLKYYQRQMIQLVRANRDSFIKSDQVVALSQRMNQLYLRSGNYFGVTIMGNLLHTNYSAFNRSITASGFTAMKPMAFQFGFGLSSRAGRGHFDFYFWTIGFNNRSTKGDEKITSSLTNVLQPEFGYSIIQKGILDVYPYVGLSLRIASLNYSAPVQTNPGFTNISNIITSDRKVVSSGNALAYQAGIGIDLKIGGASNNLSSTLLFLKAGTNSTFGTDTYPIEGIRYQPGIQHGDWFVGIGFKFVGVQ